MSNAITWITGDIFTSPDPEKTLSAWKPYSVCLGVLFQLQNSDVEPRWQGWQVHWIAGMSMLRTIGYVLKKVDARKDVDHQTVIEQFWRRWTERKGEHWIFWEFVDLERHNILKEFDLGFAYEPYLEPEDYEVEEIVYEKLHLYREAVYWWRTQLRAMEGEISERMNS